MRKPSDFITAAVRNVQNRYMADSAATLTCGASCAKVTRAASVRRGEDEVSGDAPAETARVLALASDFPTVTKGDVATLDGDTRIVTSVRVDCFGASCYVGLSDSLTVRTASVFGHRGQRLIRFPVELLALDNGLANDVTDGYAPTTVRAWTLVTAVDAWPENEWPQIGDELRFEKDGEDVRVKVARCDRRAKHYIVSARSR